jgi:hypothetical protein
MIGWQMGFVKMETSPEKIKDHKSDEDGSPSHPENNTQQSFWIQTSYLVLTKSHFTFP